MRSISNRCQRYQSDVFQTRLMLQKFICMRGKEAAQLFYDNERFKREGAAPQRLKKTLFGQGGVQGMDGTPHRGRKQMFMSLMTPEGIGRLVNLTSDQWRTYLGRWENQNSVVLFDEVREPLCRAVCAWAGVPLKESEVEQRTVDLGAMIDGSGAVGLRHWQGRWARKRAERWAGNLVEEVRAQRLTAAEGNALHVVAWHRSSEGELLDRRRAAVELL